MKAHPLNGGRARLLFDDSPALGFGLEVERPRLSRAAVKYLDIWATLLNLKGDLPLDDMVVIADHFGKKYPALNLLIMRKLGW